MKSKHISIILLALIMVSFMATLALYSQLPNQIPMHWNVKGEVDRYGGRIMIFMTLGLPLLLMGLFKVLPMIDPKRDNYRKHKKAYEMTIFGIVLMMVILHWMILLSSVGYNIKIDQIVPILVGVLFIVIGNYMTQVRHNYFFGIRTPWTLASETVWKKTHRLGGYLFSFTGIMTIILSIINTEYAFYGLMIMVFSLVFITFTYSYILYRNENFRG